MSENKKIKFDDKTSIYDYFKGHNSLFIACVSGIIAFISFFVSLLSFLSTKIYLKEYNVLPEMIQINVQGNLFYKIVASIVYFIMIIAAEFIIENYIHQYYMFSVVGIYNSLFDEKLTLSYLKKERKRDQLITLLRIIPCIVLTAIAVFLFDIANYNLTWNTPIFILLIILMVIMISYISGRRKNRKYGIKEITKRVERIKEKRNENDEDIVLVMKDFADITERVMRQGKITNNNVINSSIIIVIALIVSFGFVVANSIREANNKTQYQIYYEGDKQYAVIYQVEKSYILEEIEIYGDELVIYRNKQRYLVSDDLAVEYMGFKSVKKIDSLDNIKDIQIIYEQSAISEKLNEGSLLSSLGPVVC